MDEDTVCIRWGCTSNVPVKRVINKAGAIHQVNNKTEFRKVLDAHGLCPKTWWAGNYPDLPDEFDLVVRPNFHAQGRNLHHCRTINELERAIAACGPGWYASELFPKTHEYRVCLVQGRVAWVASKTPGNPDDIAWNVARGGRFDNVRWDDWPIPVVRVATRAFNQTDLDFGGVDVMWDENTKQATVLEINSAPSLTSPYRQQCMAKCFDHIMREEDKTRMGSDLKGKTWKSFYHPALAANR
jgi:glutathione synthase/RimK-type ligase-like ATP-grasp enzyme